jgi:hypothetical protein
MISTPRAVLAGVGAAVFMGCANAQGLRSRNKPPSVDGPYGPAAEYSAARRGVSLLVMQGGKVLLETYPRPGGAAKGHELASGTKSFTGVMAALASADGLLNIDEPVARALFELRDGDAIGEVALGEDVAMAAGAGDQRLYLMWKRGLVIVRQANEILKAVTQSGLKWRDDEFLRLLPT